jgi:hypothetical protein
MNMKRRYRRDSIGETARHAPAEIRRGLASVVPQPFAEALIRSQPPCQSFCTNIAESQSQMPFISHGEALATVSR